MRKLNIALVAHDARKKELIEWAKFNYQVLTQHNLYATGTTGDLIKFITFEEDPQLDEYGWGDKFPKTERPFKNIICLLSGPIGGDQQIGAMIAEKKIDILIFFCDNLITQGHQQDVGALSRLASLYNIAFATNRTTADMILTSPLFASEDYKPIEPNFSNYLNRM